MCVFRLFRDLAQDSVQNEVPKLTSIVLRIVVLRLAVLRLAVLGLVVLLAWVLQGDISGSDFDVCFVPAWVNVSL